MAAADVSFFAQINGQFAALTYTAEEIPVLPFLAAVDAWLPLFDRLGSVFSPVKSDIGGNIEKLKKIQKETGCTTLQQMVKRDVDAGTTKKSTSACESLLWLKRAFEFMWQLLSKLADSTREASECAREAYDATLSKYHGFIVRGTFTTALKMAPYRAKMLAQLGPNEAQSIADMKQWCNIVEPLLAALNTYYTSNKLDNEAKV